MRDRSNTRCKSRFPSQIELLEELLREHSERASKSTEPPVEPSLEEEKEDILTCDYLLVDLGRTTSKTSATLLKPCRGDRAGL